MYQLEPMSSRYAYEISGWSYPAEYSIYSFHKDDETVHELMSGEYYACVGSEKHLIGYFCFGKSAQIPTVESNVYPVDALDIGLGLKPELCGKGLGPAFMKTGMEYAREKLGAENIRLTVASFNRRAVNLYRKLGFEIADTVTHKKSQGKFYLMRCKSLT